MLKIQRMKENSKGQIRKGLIGYVKEPGLVLGPMVMVANAAPSVVCGPQNPLSYLTKFRFVDPTSDSIRIQMWASILPLSKPCR